MILCDVVNDSELPDVCIHLASNSKIVRQIMETVFKEKAPELRMPNPTPIDTPSLA
jgi:hypothetical protein